jgi:ketosteroid isomerase-like protein
MSVEKNRAVVLDFYKLMSELRFEEMFELMSDDGTWTVAGLPQHFHHAGVATKAQRAQGFAGFVKVFASLEQDIRSTTAEADRVAVEAWTRCRTHQGLLYENEMLILIRCRDGKIVSIYELLDPFRTVAFEQKLHESLEQSGSSA